MICLWTCWMEHVCICGWWCFHITLIGECLQPICPDATCSSLRSLFCTETRCTVWGVLRSWVLRSWPPGDSGRMWGSAPWSCFASTWACDSHHSQKCGSMTGKHCQMIGCCSSKVEASTICLVTGGLTWLDGGYPLPWCWACLTRLPQTKLCLLLLAHTACQCSNPTWFVIIYPPSCWSCWIKFTPSTLKPTMKFSVWANFHQFSRI